MKAKEVLQILQITRVTLCKYVKEGIIKATRVGNSNYQYDEESVMRLLGKDIIAPNKINVIYARTSNPPKRYAEEQAQRLLQYCTMQGVHIDKIFIDVKSGMNFQRKGFLELIDLITESKVSKIFIENKDRLVRFGFELLQELCKKSECEIVVVNDLSDKNFEQELTEDLISIIHYFTMKSYSNRRKLNKLKKELMNDNSEN